MDIAAIWPLDNPTLTPLTGKGENNLLWVVESTADKYILRAYGQHADPARIDYELAVVATLQDKNLPFAVPAPLPTRTGDVLARIVLDDNSEKLAALWPFVAGSVPERDDPNVAFAAGAALGQVLTALKNVRIDDPKVRAPSAYHPLNAQHPAVPDPQAAIAVLPLDSGQKARLLDLYEELDAKGAHITATLPRQIIHSDYIRPNLLVEGSRITAVLDWEFATPDMRMMDVAVLLDDWTRRFRTENPDWTIFAALCRGIASTHRFEANEIEALPDLLRLQLMAWLFRFLGRNLAGLDTPEMYLLYVRGLFELDDWLQQYGAELVRLAHDWFGLTG